MKKLRVNNKEGRQVPYLAGHHRMHTQITMILRPAKDIQLDAIKDMPL